MDSDTEDEEDAEMSVKGRLLSLVVRVIGLKKKPTEEEVGRPQSASKCVLSASLNIYDTILSKVTAFYHFFMRY